MKLMSFEPVEETAARRMPRLKYTSIGCAADLANDEARARTLKEWSRNDALRAERQEILEARALLRMNARQQRAEARSKKQEARSKKQGAAEL